MHIPRIYIPQTLSENSTIELEPSAAHHIATVMRMKVGRSVILFNGMPYGDQEGEFEATLAYVSKKSVAVAINSFVERKTESSLEIELGVCLIKNDRMDWLLQKATELGVTSISPLWSEYTDVKIPADRLDKKMQHWQKVIINACEQSGRTRIPSIQSPQSIQLWVENVTADKRILLHPYTKQADKQDNTLSSVALLVGPEGGLTENEVEMAIKDGFEGWVLGSRILRAETAPLAALSVLQSRFGDF